MDSAHSSTDNTRVTLDLWSDNEDQSETRPESSSLLTSSLVTSSPVEIHPLTRQTVSASLEKLLGPAPSPNSRQSPSRDLSPTPRDLSPTPRDRSGSRERLSTSSRERLSMSSRERLSMSSGDELSPSRETLPYRSPQHKPRELDVDPEILHRTSLIEDSWNPLDDDEGDGDDDKQNGGRPKSCDALSAASLQLSSDSQPKDDIGSLGTGLDSTEDELDSGIMGSSYDELPVEIRAKRQRSFSDRSSSRSLDNELDFSCIEVAPRLAFDGMKHRIAVTRQSQKLSNRRRPTRPQRQMSEDVVAGGSRVLLEAASMLHTTRSPPVSPSGGRKTAHAHSPLLQRLSPMTSPRVQRASPVTSPRPSPKPSPALRRSRLTADQSVPLTGLSSNYDSNLVPTVPSNQGLYTQDSNLVPLNPGTSYFEAKSLVNPAVSPSASLTPVATPTASLTPVATPTASLTPVATPTASLTPVATPTASFTPVATPTTSLTPLATSTGLIPDVTASVQPPIVILQKTQELDAKPKTQELDTKTKIRELGTKLKTQDLDTKLKTQDLDNKLKTQESDAKPKTQGLDTKLKPQELDAKPNTQGLDTKPKTQKSDANPKTHESDTKTKSGMKTKMAAFSKMDEVGDGSKVNDESRTPLIGGRKTPVLPEIGSPTKLRLSSKSPDSLTSIESARLRKSDSPVERLNPQTQSSLQTDPRPPSIKPAPKERKPSPKTKPKPNLPPKCSSPTWFDKLRLRKKSQSVDVVEIERKEKDKENKDKGKENKEKEIKEKEKEKIVSETSKCEPAVHKPASIKSTSLKGTVSDQTPQLVSQPPPDTQTEQPSPQTEQPPPPSNQPPWLRETRLRKSTKLHQKEDRSPVCETGEKPWMSETGEKPSWMREVMARRRKTLEKLNLGDIMSVSEGFHASNEKKKKMSDNEQLTSDKCKNQSVPLQQSADSDNSSYTNLKNNKNSASKSLTNQNGDSKSRDSIVTLDQSPSRRPNTLRDENCPPVRTPGRMSDDRVGIQSNVKTSSPTNLAPGLRRTTVVPPIISPEKSLSPDKEVALPSWRTELANRKSLRKVPRTGEVIATRTSDVTTTRTSDVTTTRTSDITATKASDVTATRTSDVTATRTSDVTATRTSAVTVTKASDVTTSRTSDVTATKTSDVTALRTSDVTATRTSDVTSFRTSDLTASRSSDVTATRTSDVTAGSDVPRWKRDLLEKKKVRCVENEEDVSLEGLPPWKRELVRKKKERETKSDVRDIHVEDTDWKSNVATRRARLLNCGMIDGVEEQSQC